MIIFIILTLLVFVYVTYYLTFERQINKRPKQCRIILGIRVDSTKPIRIHRVPIKKQWEILTFSKKDWEEWDFLIDETKVLAKKYPRAVSYYISSCFANAFFRTSKTRKEYINNGDVVSEWIDILNLDEIRSVYSVTDNAWKQSTTDINEVELIRSNYAVGLKLFEEINKDYKSFADIVRAKKQIISLDERGCEALRFDDWEKRQKLFADNEGFKLAKNCYESHTPFKYERLYSRFDKFGKRIDSSYKLSVGYIDRFSPRYLRFQNDNFQNTYKNLERLKTTNRIWKEFVYENIFKAIDNFDKTETKSELLVIFVDGNSYKWPKSSYSYHLSKLKSLLNEALIDYVMSSELKADSFSNDYKSVIFIDLISNNDDMYDNCEKVIKICPRVIPTISYLIFSKELTDTELSRIFDIDLSSDPYEKEMPVELPVESPAGTASLNALKARLESKKALKQEEKTKYLSFIRQQFERVVIAQRYHSIAIVNALIGEAEGAHIIKRVWLDNPEKYLLCKDKNGITGWAYSCDQGLTYKEFPYNGLAHSREDAAEYAYNLFEEMGVLEQFYQKGAYAVDKFNNSFYLKH